MAIINANKDTCPLNLNRKRPYAEIARKVTLAPYLQVVSVKTCNICGDRKHIDDFIKGKRYCKICYRAKQKKEGTYAKKPVNAALDNLHMPWAGKLEAQYVV